MHNLTIEQVQGCVAKLNKLLPGHEIVAAGGCLRDIICRKPIKDLDFFIQADPADHFTNVAGPLWQEFSCGTHSRDDFYQLGPKKVDSYGSGRSIEYHFDFSVVEYERGWYGFPIQLVYLDGSPRAEVASKFDFALSRIWADASRLRLSSEFTRDYDSRRLSYFGSGWGRTSPERMAKMRAKFSDYRFNNLSGAPL